MNAQSDATRGDEDILTAVMDALPHVLHPINGDSWRVKADALILSLDLRGYAIVAAADLGTAKPIEAANLTSSRWNALAAERNHLIYTIDTAVDLIDDAQAAQRRGLHVDWWTTAIRKARNLLAEATAPLGMIDLIGDAAEEQS